MNRYANVACAGVDVHYRFSKMAFRDINGNLVGRERLNHPDRQRLKEWLARLPDGLPIVMESSFGWPWLSDMMDEANLKPMLSNCAKVDKMRDARGWCKTNDKDADLISLLPFESSHWWEVWRAPKDVRDRRELIRYRANVVAVQTETKNRIHALFHRHGVFHEFSDLFGGKGRVFLTELCRGNDERIQGGALRAFRGYVVQLDRLRQELADIARILKRELFADPLTLRLKSIPGIGLILSHVFAAEIGKIDRFGNHRKLASYSCLAPRSSDTGEDKPNEKPKSRHLGWRGNLTLKWAFIEAARGAVRHGGRFRDIFDRHTDGGRKQRNRGYITVARELVKIVFAIWRNKTTYSETPPIRPGTSKDHQPPKQSNKKTSPAKTGKRKKSQPENWVRNSYRPRCSGGRETRSETGQLNHPMAAVQQ